MKQKTTDTTGARQECAREGCTTAPFFGEKFCSVLHRRQHELLYGWDAELEESDEQDVPAEPLQQAQAHCARRGCTAPAMPGSVYCTAVHERWDNPRVAVKAVS